MKKDKWIWMPHPAHLIVGFDCRFHLATYVGNYIVSTVGEYFPDYPIREIYAELKGVKLEGRGDDRKNDYMMKIGFEEIGFNRKYETMVFHARKSQDICCPYRADVFNGEKDFGGYNSGDEATKGHYKLCEKWSKKK